MSTGEGYWVPSAHVVALRTDLTLDNRGDAPVIIDGVQVGRPTQSGYSAPRLLGCFVAPTHALMEQATNWDGAGSQPALPKAAGYRLAPTPSRGFAPYLSLLMGPGGPQTTNSYVAVEYHALDGTRYVAVFNAGFLFCVSGEAPPGCLDPRS